MTDAPEAEFVVSEEGLRSWAHRSRPGAAAVYHLGNLAIDRARRPVVDAISSLALVLSEAGVVRLTTRASGVGKASLYLATRTSSRPNHSLVIGMIDWRQWLSLRAVKNREPSQSATRAVRDALSCEDAVADLMLSGLEHLGFVERVQGDHGSSRPALVLTQRGHAAL